MARFPKSPRAARLSVEALENRAVPASLIVGTVSASGLLTLTGDDQANVFVLKDTGANMQVTGDADNLIRVGPAGALGLTQTFVGVKAVKLVLKGGNDVVSLDAAGTLTLPGAFTADMGDGDNTLNLANGEDAVAASVGSLDYKGLGGIDAVTVGAANHTTAVAGKVTISAGDAANAVSLRNTTVAGDLTYFGLVGADVITLGVGTVVGQNVTADFGASNDSNHVLMFGGSVSGNMTLKGIGGTISVSTGNPTTISGPTGLTISAGLNGSAFLTLGGSLSVPNGGVTLTGVNGQAQASGFFSSTLSMAKDLTVSNRAATVLLDGLSARKITVSAVETADLSVAGSGVLATGAVKVTSSAGEARATLAGAATAVSGAVTVTGRFSAAVYDNAWGAASFGSTVAVTATQGIATFDQQGSSTLTVTGALTVKGFVDAYIGLEGSFPKTLSKDVTLTATTGLANLTAEEGKTTFAGNVVVKGVSNAVRLMANAAGSSFGKNLTVTGGLSSDTVTWEDGFNVLGNATFNLGSGATTLNIGGAGTLTEVKNLAVTTVAGVDNLLIDNFKVNGTAAVKTGAGADNVEIDRSTFMSTFTLDAGDGDDTLSIARDDNDAPVTFTGKATIKLGAGNDTLELGTPGVDLDKAVFSAAGSTIDGGLGYNVYEDDLGQGLATANLTLTQFTNPI